MCCVYSLAWVKLRKVHLQKGSTCFNLILIESRVISSRLKKINTVFYVKFISTLIFIPFSPSPQTTCCLRSSRWRLVRCVYSPFCRNVYVTRGWAALCATRTSAAMRLWPRRRAPCTMCTTIASLRGVSCVRCTWANRRRYDCPRRWHSATPPIGWVISVPPTCR